MKSFIKTFLLVLLLLFTVVAIFTVFNETSLATIGFLTLYTILTLYLALYFLYSKKIAKKWELSYSKFNIFLFSIWNVMSIVIAFILQYLVDINILQGSGGFLSGVEYVIFPFLFILFSILILVIKFIYWLYKNIKYGK